MKRHSNVTALAMRPISLVVAFLMLQLVPVTPATGDLLFARFESYLESLRIQTGIPGLAAAIVGENEVVWERAFGHQDLERSLQTRADTPFHLDGLTQVVTASIVLECVEQGRLSLDDTIGRFDPDSSDANATIGQVLSHTRNSANGPVFSYRPDRLEPLRSAVRTCTGDSYRETVANLLDRLGMKDSAPGADVAELAPPAEGVPDEATADRYTAVLSRLATSYSVRSRGRASRSLHAATTISPARGLVSTVLDFAQFDLALRNGDLLSPETLALAWRAPLGRAGQPLPHGLGWFVQTYNGETVVWQFGVTDNASSSLVMTVPSRGLTMILLANSDGLVKPFALTTGSVTASPFARVFLGLAFP